MEVWLRLEVNFFCLAVLVVVLFEEGLRRRDRRSSDQAGFLGLVVSTMAMLALDSAGWLVDGSRGALGRFFVYAVNIAYYCCHSLPLLFFLSYMDFQLFRDGAHTRRLRPLLATLFAVVAVAALAVPFTGFLFFVDASNHYHRGPGFIYFAIFSYCLAFSSLVLIVAKRRLVSRRVFITLLSYPIPVILLGLLQALQYGLVLIWPFVSIFLLVASFNIQRAQASTDHLTGTANRRSLDEELESRVQDARRGRGFGAILVDLDDFKSINDSLGHETGDRALEDAAAILRSVVRFDDLVARYGGDEFVVVLGLSESGRLSDIIARLEREIEAHNSGARRPYSLSFSVGAGVFDPKSDADARAFLGRIDSLMYADKLTRKRKA